jgi:hypothetical protein
MLRGIVRGAAEGTETSREEQVVLINHLRLELRVRTLKGSGIPREESRR